MTMTEDERDILKVITNARTELAILSLKDINPRYAEIYQQQEDGLPVVDEILKHLSDKDRRTVLRYYEDEVHKFTFETDAAYLQGVRDCVKALMFFGVFSSGCRK